MSGPWKILVVDDSEDIHAITQLALRRRTWRNREFELTSAFSGEEGRARLKEIGTSFQVAIIDVVMESDDAGLELCKYIRSTFPASLRIILRTGQPGVAPPSHILNTYDIDHYLLKSDADADRLFALVRSCLRTSEDIIALEEVHARMVVAHSELQRQNERNLWIQARLGDPETGLLPQLHEAIAALGDHVPESLRQTSSTIQTLGTEALRILAPHDFDAGYRVTLSSKSILVLQNSLRGRNTIVGALAGLGATVVVGEDWEDTLKVIREGQIDLLMVDWDNLGVINEAIRYNPKVVTVLMTSQPLFKLHGEQMLSLPIASAVVINALASDQPPTRRFEPYIIHELVVTAGKLLSGEVFGMHKYLSWGAQAHDMVLTKSKHKEEALTALDSFGKQCRMRGSLRERLVMFADELLMNAIFEAPVDRTGNPKYVDLPRSAEIELDPDETVIMRYASDGNYLAVSVTDNFGRLRRDTACKYLVRCFDKDDTPRADSTDAGLGLYMAYQAISSLVINCDPGVKTEIIGIMNLRIKAKDSHEHGRAFHYFATPHRAHLK